MRAGRRTTCFLLLLLLVGCRHNKELLETELRTKEIQYRELLDEHERTEHRNEALEREIATIRQGTPITPEQAAQTFTVKRITLGRSTGGQNTDKEFGDDALQVVLEPRDGADHIIKAPGTLQVWALEIDKNGVKVPLSSWVIPPNELARSWKNGFLGSGYTLTLPWKTPPHTENLRVVVRLVMTDARTFEADKDVRIRLGTLPPPRPLMPEGPPIPDVEGPACPVQGKAAAATSVAPAGHWQPVQLGDAVKLQRPVPLYPE